MDNLANNIMKIIRNDHFDTATKIRHLIDIFKLRGGRLDSSGSARLFGFEINYNRLDSLTHVLREIFIDFSYFVKLGKDSPVIFDIGSNIGIATLFFKRMYPGSVVYSFEPDPDTFNILMNNIKKNNLKDVFVINAGISNFHGKTKLYVPYWSNGSSSIFREKIDIEMGYAKQCFAYPGPGIGEKEIRVMRGSEFIKENGIEHIDLMKIDAEGAEADIIDDISEIMAMVDFIVLEHHYSKDFVGKNSLAGIISSFEKANFLVSVKPTWLTRKPEVMCTYIVKAANGKYIDESSLSSFF